MKKLILKWLGIQEIKNDLLCFDERLDDLEAREEITERDVDQMIQDNLDLESLATKDDLDDQISEENDKIMKLIQEVSELKAIIRELQNVRKS